MTIKQPSQTPVTDSTRWAIFRDMKIGRKLTYGFGILVVMTLIVIAFSYYGSVSATSRINITDEVRVPAALASAEAQADLLRTLADVRGYLALGDPIYRESYAQNIASFEGRLETLKVLSVGFNEQNRQRLTELETTFEEWAELPEPLFDLRDDQLAREPAYQLLATTGSQLAGTVLIDINVMIEIQGDREPTETNLALLEDMAKFQGTFASMFSGLRGYVTTRNRIFRLEYEGNLAANENNWQRINTRSFRLTESQRVILDDIRANRNAFLELPDQIFETMEGERWREDLYLFRTETVPRAERMQQLLEDITNEQQTALARDLNEGRQGLDVTNQQTVISGLIALVLGLGLSYIFRENIAGPIRRLTDVAERIREGDLQAQAQVESRDEIGTLASTFNSMTTKLRETLFQVRKEKRRADDLLEVVIPIGVELSWEKDFNRLLEKMLVEAQTFCNADAGTLYLQTGNELEAVIVRNLSLNITMGGTSGQPVKVTKIPLKSESGEPNHENIVATTVLTGESVNVANRYEDHRFHKGTMVGLREDYQAVSHLSIPLKNNSGEVVGAMQLINAQDLETKQVIPFDKNIQEMMESFSSLAVAALEAYKREQTLRQEIKQLRIQIDEAKREQAVKAIVESEGFSDLQAKAESMRRRRQRRPKKNE